MNAPLGWLGAAHGKLVFGRRVERLGAAIAELLPQGATVADVGCGSGSIAGRVLRDRPDLTIEGWDVLVRPETHIPVRAFDGRHLPLADGSVDFVVFVDVLHHTGDPGAVLREGVRVARKGVVIKDHRMERRFAESLLRVMDYVGNRPHGVALPYDYWPEARWRAEFDRLGLRVDAWIEDLRLYPRPVDRVFGDGLHFVARLLR